MLTSTHGPWTARWSGGRLADVYHAESDTAQDCVQVGNFDWATYDHRHCGQRSLDRALREWVAEVGSDYARNLS